MCCTQEISPSSSHSPYISSISKTCAEWRGRLVRWIQHVGSKIADFLAKHLHWLASNCVVASSSQRSKKKLDSARFTNSRKAIQDFGGVFLDLKTSRGHTISAVYFEAKKCHERLIQLGAVPSALIIDDQEQNILWIPPNALQLREMLKNLGLSLEMHEGREYITVAQSENQQKAKSAVIYAHGSGNLYEWRKKTAALFTLKFGMDIISFNYSGTGKSHGSISEQGMYDDIETVYQFIKSQGFDDDKILSYGYCTGSGPAVHLASTHPQLNLLVDRGFVSMSEFAELRVQHNLLLPRLFPFLTSWVPSVMKRCYHFNNIEKIQYVRGAVATMRGEKDYLIPPSYLTRLYDNIKSARVRVHMTQDSNHHIEIAPDASAQAKLRDFLQRANLI